jgi:hypothetical protein
MHAQFQSSADHQEELNHLKKTYEAKLAYKTQETATAEAMLAKVMKDSGKSTNQVRVGFQPQSWARIVRP